MKLTSSFKLAKESKVCLASYINSHHRGEIKRMLIGAQLISEVKVKPSKKDKEVETEQ